MARLLGVVPLTPTQRVRRYRDRQRARVAELESALDEFESALEETRESEHEYSMLLVVWMGRVSDKERTITRLEAENAQLRAAILRIAAQSNTREIHAATVEAMRLIQAPETRVGHDSSDR